MKERMVFTIKRNDATEVQVECHGFVSLISADVKTDNGAQCMTLHFPNKLLTDLTFPADVRLNPESLLVIISRVQTLEQTGLLLPLYRTNSERENYVKELNEVIEIKGEQKDELLGIEMVHDETVVKLAACERAS